MKTAEHIYRVQDIEDCCESETRLELVRGELIEMPPAGFEHGDIALEIGTELKLYARQTGTGRVAGAETGFVISENPDVMLAPDASFVLADRLPPRSERGRFLRLAPDLAVEVASPNDSANYINRNVAEYLAAGVRLVWVIYPESRSVSVFDDTGQVQFLNDTEALDGGDVLPGFSVPIERLFA